MEKKCSLNKQNIIFVVLLLTINFISMNRFFIVLTSTVIMVSIFYGCKSKQAVEAEKPSPVYIGDNVRNNLDWSGTYTGVLPCADCSGIETRLSLYKDGNYILIQKYQGKEGSFESKGTFKWSSLVNNITLTDAKNGTDTHYAVAEQQITQLDLEGNVITGQLANNYILAKINSLLVGKRWKLAELAGKPVEANAFISIAADDNRVSGNLSCNIFSGTYELKTGNRIKFSQIAVTQKMCLKMEVEESLKEILEVVDSYSVSESTLVLNRARMAPLAKFVSEK
jgi:heat shock protein HslJ